jgi:hypothetical protein
MRLEQLEGPRCGGRDGDPVTLRADTRCIVRCTRRGLAFVNPRPTAADVAELYGERYFDADVRDGAGYSDYPVSGASIRRTGPYLPDYPDPGPPPGAALFTP